MLEEMIKVSELGPGYVSPLLSAPAGARASNSGGKAAAAGRQQGYTNPQHQQTRGGAPSNASVQQHQGARRPSPAQLFPRPAWMQQQYQYQSAPLHNLAPDAFPTSDQQFILTPGWGIGAEPSNPTCIRQSGPVAALGGTSAQFDQYWSNPLQSLYTSTRSFHPLLEQQDAMQQAHQMAMALMMASPPCALGNIGNLDTLGGWC